MLTSSQRRLIGNRAFSLLWLAGFISMTGDWLLRVALPIYVYQLSGSVTATAGAVAARVVVVMVVAPVAGALVDRWDRRQVMIWANLLQAVILLPLLAVGTAADLWIAYTVIALQATIATFVFPAEHALLPSLVAADDLPAANGFNALNNNLARLIGPMAGGIVAVGIGLHGAVLLDSTALVCAGVLAVFIGGTHRATSAAPPKHLLHEIADGTRAIAASYPLRALFAVVAVSAIGEGILGSLFPAYVVDLLHGDAKVIGWLLSAQAIGGIVGGLAIGYLARKINPRITVAIGLVAFGLIDLVIFNYPRWFTALGPVIVLFIIVGIPAAIMGAAAFTILQAEVADELRARVMATVIVVEGLSSLIGAGMAGWLTPHLGVTNMLTAQGTAYVLSAAAFALVIRRAPAQTPATATTAAPATVPTSAPTPAPTSVPTSAPTKATATTAMPGGQAQPKLAAPGR